MVRTERSVDDYDRLFDPIRETRQKKHGAQLGDPKKLAEAVLTLVMSENPPPQPLFGQRCPGSERNRRLGSGGLSAARQAT